MHQPATDLGFLLMKHPDRVHEIDLAFGKAVVFFPEATEARCEAALVLDIDPVGLVRRSGDSVVDQYVNDRPYAASSFLSVALNTAFRTAMTGVSRERPELAQTSLPLEIVVTPLPLRAQEDFPARLFEPLGWSVEIERIAGRKGPSRYVKLTLRGTLRLADALSHLYVLIPALDRDKHYWVGDDEVEKLLAKAGSWFALHPEREEIARRYLKNRRALVQAALARLAPEEAAEETESTATAPDEKKLEAPLRLNDQRLDAVARVLGMSDAVSMVDLGCGEGKLLALILRHKRFARIIGLDASAKSLERASQRLKLDRAGAPSKERLQLLHGALTYRDARWKGVDAAALVEVIEHLDADRLPALEEVVFGDAKPKLVVVTTPNAEHNVLFEGLAPGAFRHADHRFEWTRAQFQDWAASVCARYGYGARFEEIGESHVDHGAPTQMAVFTPAEAARPMEAPGR